MAEWHVDADRLSIASLIWLNVRNTVATVSYTPDAVVKKVEAEHTFWVVGKIQRKKCQKINRVDRNLNK